MPTFCVHPFRPDYGDRSTQNEGRLWTSSRSTVISVSVLKQGGANAITQSEDALLYANGVLKHYIITTLKFVEQKQTIHWQVIDLYTHRKGGIIKSRFLENNRLFFCWFNVIFFVYSLVVWHQLGKWRASRRLALNGTGKRGRSPAADLPSRSLLWLQMSKRDSKTSTSHSTTHLKHNTGMVVKKSNICSKQ